MSGTLAKIVLVSFLVSGVVGNATVMSQATGLATDPITLMRDATGRVAVCGRGSSADGSIVRVAATQDLSTVAMRRPAGTIFCLGAGTFHLRERVYSQPGDRFIGRGRSETFIRPADVGQLTNGFSSTSPTSTVPVTYAHFDIGRFQAPLSNTSCDDACGTAIANIGSPVGGGVLIRDVRCHNNGTSCIGHGYGSVIADNIECDHNGYHPDSLLLDYRSSACIKMTEGSMVVRDSYIHDNAFDALWCDHCGHSQSLIQHNIIVRNGRSGVYWEMSGQYVSGDHLVVRNNMIKNNGRNCGPQGSQMAAGVTSEDGSNVLVADNRFGGNSACGDGGRRAVYTFDGPADGVVDNIMISSNTLDGDRLDSCARPGVSCSGNR